MKKLILAFFLALPCIVFGQTPADDSVIYSKFLQYFQAERKMQKANFVINQTPYFTRKYGPLNADEVKTSDFLSELRAFSKNKKSGISLSYSTFRDFTVTLIKDTLWFSVMTSYDNEFNLDFPIGNHFTNQTQTLIIDRPTFERYFNHMKGRRRIDRAWARFHKKYGIYALLTEFSKIATDGQRALFYFSFRCNGLCGEGDLVFFEKQNEEWKCLGNFALWYN